MGLENSRKPGLVTVRPVVGSLVVEDSIGAVGSEPKTDSGLIPAALNILPAALSIIDFEPMIDLGLESVTGVRLPAIPVTLVAMTWGT